MHDVDRDVLRPDRLVALGLGIEFDAIAGHDRMARARLWLLVEQQSSSLDPAMQTTARILVAHLGEGAIQARALQGLRNTSMQSYVFFGRLCNSTETRRIGNTWDSTG